MGILEHRARMGDVKATEEAGEVADSMNVRKQILARVHAGELTPSEAQAELARIKRGAAKRGQKTRSSVYRNGR